MDIENIGDELQRLIDKFELTKTGLGLDVLSERLTKLMKERESLTFWNNLDFAMQTNKEIKALQDLFTEVQSVQSQLSSLIDMVKSLEKETDIEMLNLAFTELLDLKEKVDDLNVKTFLDGKYDNNDAIITIHSGAGGTEACDWADMIYQMYTRWATSKNYKIEVLDYQEGEEAGIKSATLLS